MTVVTEKIRLQLRAMPTLRADEDPRLSVPVVLPWRPVLDEADLKIDTELQGLSTRVPMRVYVSRRLRDIHAEPPWPYADHFVQVIRYSREKGCWEWGSKGDFHAAFDAAVRADYVGPPASGGDTDAAAGAGPPTVFVALAFTRSFDFAATGATRERAVGALMTAWRAHADLTGADPDAVTEHCVKVLAGPLGQAFRDGSPFPRADG